MSQPGQSLSLGLARGPLAQRPRTLPPPRPVALARPAALARPQAVPKVLQPREPRAQNQLRLQAAAPVPILPGSHFDSLLGSGDVPYWLEAAVSKAAQMGIFAVKDRTNTKYLQTFTDFASFARIYGEQSLPAGPAITLAYLVDVLDRGFSKSDFVGRFAAIDYVHELHGYPLDQNPTSHPALMAFKRGASNYIGSAPRNVKEPLPWATVLTFVQRSLDQPTTYICRQLGICFILSVCGLLRADDALQLQVGDVLQESSGEFVLFLHERKTDKFVRGQKVMLDSGTDASSGLPLGRYLSRFLAERRTILGSPPKPSDPLFLAFEGRQYIPFTPTSAAQAQAQPLAYHQWRYWLLYSLAQVMNQPMSAIANTYGTHSLRKAGATEMLNRGVPEEVIMRHGNWRTKEAFEAYLRPAPRVTLPASAALVNPQRAPAIQVTAPTLPKEFFPPLDEADIPCEICHGLSSLRRNRMLLCDGEGCNKGFHKVCLNLDRLPTSLYWYCDACKAAYNSKKRKVAAT